MNHTEIIAAKDAQIAQLTACVAQHQQSLIDAKRELDAAIAPAPIQSAEVRELTPKARFMWVSLFTNKTTSIQFSLGTTARGDVDVMAKELLDSPDIDTAKVYEVAVLKRSDYDALTATPAQPAADVSAPTDDLTQFDIELMQQKFPLPETRYNGCGDGSEPLYTPDMVFAYAHQYAAAMAHARKPELDKALVHIAKLEAAARAAAPVGGPSIKSFAAQQNAELVMARLEQMHKDSVPGTRRDQIEEAMPCMLAVLRHLSGNSAAPVSGQPPAAAPEQQPDSLSELRDEGWITSDLPAPVLIKKLLTIIGNAYQVAGAHDAPEHILDVLSDPEAATDEQVEAMLPYAPTAAPAPIQSAELAELKRLAEAATPGAWEHSRFGALVAGPVQHYSNGSGREQIAMTTGANWMRKDEHIANAEFIAAANPPVILRLLAALAAPTPVQASSDEFTDAMWHAWSGIDNTLSGEEMATIYRAVRAAAPKAQPEQAKPTDFPRIPTEAMLVAARDWSVETIGHAVGNAGATGCWQAMYDAARHAAAELVAASSATPKEPT